VSVALLEIVLLVECYRDVVEGFWISWVLTMRYYCARDSEFVVLGLDYCSHRCFDLSYSVGQIEAFGVQSRCVGLAPWLVCVRAGEGVQTYFLGRFVGEALCS
jgi:hypothetical protein